MCSATSRPVASIVHQDAIQAWTAPWVARLSWHDRNEPLAVTEHDPGAPLCLFRRNGWWSLVAGAPEAEELPTTDEPNDDEALANAAARLLTGFQGLGPEVASRLGGHFAAVIIDTARGRAILVRDALGMYPLFYARVPHGWVVSNDALALVRQPDVSDELNRPYMAERLAAREVPLAETYYVAVRRVPPGHWVQLDRAVEEAHRYWDPCLAIERGEWLTEDEVAEFGARLQAVVERCVAVGRCAIFMSGGIDSVTLAAIASDLSRRRNGSKPLALSIVFPPPADESAVQRAVAQQLGIPQVLEPFEALVGRHGVFHAAALLNARWSFPLVNHWLPLYMDLARIARKDGCRAVLSGEGGDE